MKNTDFFLFSRTAAGGIPIGLIDAFPASFEIRPIMIGKVSDLPLP
jgi:hypothetical protein